MKPQQIDIGDGKTIPFIRAAFDEGLEFVGMGILRLLSLFHKVFGGPLRHPDERRARKPEQVRRASCLPVPRK